MAVVKIILDIKSQAWIDSNSSKVLDLNVPIYRNDGLVAYGDGVTPLSGLTFLPLFTNEGTIQYITTATSATPAETDILVSISALASDIFFAEPISTQDAKKLTIRIKDNGTSQELTFADIYRFSSDLPAVSSTTENATIYFEFIRNSVEDTWDCIGIMNNFQSTGLNLRITEDGITRITEDNIERILETT